MKPLGDLPISSILASRFPLLPGTFSPRRLSRVDNFYSHARQLCAEFGAGKGKDSPAAIALGVPEVDACGAITMHFPIYVGLGDFSSDNQAREFSKMAEKDELAFPASDCLVGVSLGVLAQNTRIRCQSFRSLISEDAERGGASASWLALQDPEERYGACFKRAWSPAMPAPGWHYIKPIILDGAGIFGGFAVDFIRRPKGPPFPLIQENIERLLLGIYKSYYSHFGETPLDKDLDWIARGRVLDRLYLETLTAALDQDGAQLSDLFPNAASCLLFFCDGDGIKRINDQFSHRWGNEVIQMIASVLCDSLDKMQIGRCKVKGINEAIVTRWAGDEFVIVVALDRKAVPTEIVSQFKRVVERKLTVGCRKISSKLGQNIRIDLSVGWTEWLGQEGNFREAWFGQADRAMYVAKDGAKLIEALKSKSPRGEVGDHARARNGRRHSRVSMGEFSSVDKLAVNIAEILGI